MKKLLSLFITLSMLLSSIIPVSADSEIIVKLNGVEIAFDQPPIIQNDRTLVPMRKIFEALGCLVFWDEKDQSVEAWQGGGYIMTLWVNDYNMKLGNSNYITLDVPPTIINDRTLVPLRAISESMGAQVTWDGSTRTVDIYYSRTSYYPQAECNHINTIEATVKGIGNFEDIGSSTIHKVTEYVETVCEDCGYTIDTNERERTEPHNFEDNVCTDCGYKKKNSCSHSNTHDVISIDAREYENTDSSSTHKVIDEIAVYCNDCSEQIDTKYKKTDKSHNFENNVCADCGYKKSIESDNTYTRPSNPISSGSIADYIDGAFMYITVPAGKSIKIPNISNSTLKIQMDGIYNCMEYRENGTFSVGSYNEKDKKGSISIAKNSDAIIQNSGYDDLIVSIPAEYAEYQETNDKVYATLNLTEGENANIEPINNQGINVYFSNKKFEYIEYTSKALNFSSTQSTINGRSLSKIDNMIISAKGNIEIYCCPSTTNCQTTSQTAFEEYTVNSGDTVRIYSTDESSTNIHTDGSHTYDYVIYGTDGKVKGQKQNYKSDKVTIGKKCYMDFTNTSASSITIKVPSIYCRVEY